jgi:UDPglucose--hexose-1-phosphate uridylyltransferase
MCSVENHFWTSSGRLADGREIIYFDEPPGPHPRVFSIQRAPGKLRYLAGAESGVGAWISDITPEKAAHELREAR